MNDKVKIILENKQARQSGSLTFMFITLIMVILKAQGLFDWSWISIIFFPIWGPLVFIFAVLGIVGLFWLIGVSVIWLVYKLNSKKSKPWYSKK